MGTDTLFGPRNKAAASRRTPNASRPPTPTASAEAIWGQTRCLQSHADLVPGTLVVRNNKAAAGCRTPNASRLPTPTHPRQRVRNHWDQRAVPCDGVEADISPPGATEGPGSARARGVALQAALVPATPGWEMCGLRLVAVPGHFRRRRKWDGRFCLSAAQFQAQRCNPAMRLLCCRTGGETVDNAL